jgi:DNA (cytosine-5)-methyltransferase 1
VERDVIGMTVCSGIGAPEVSAPWIDWRWQSEIEAFPSAVLAHRFPHARNLGDMTCFQEWPDATVDVLCGGTPCQSFSVAGLRKGLADPRGNLMLTYLAIADRFRPRWIVWENVPGVLSSNGGRDFGAFLAGLGQLGYGFAYRVLDAQFVRSRSHPRAVPQRRRRVFVVGYPGDWRRAAAVLFDGESLSGNPPPRREAGKGSARGFEVGPGGGGFTDLSPTLDARCKDGPIRNQLGAGVICHDVAPTLNAHFGDKQGLEDQHINGGGGLFVAHALRGEGFDASEGGTGRGTPLVPVAIQERAVSENPDAGPDGAGWRQGGASYTLEARTVTQAVAFDLNQITSKANRSRPDPTVHHTLPATSCPPHLAMPWAVRRLTPTECERLQGFPDGWTDIPYRGKRAADGPRYKALGNSWAVNCGEWIFDRLQAVENRAILEAVR